METLIVYGSQYGTTKRYAEKFSQMTDIPAVSFEDIESLEQYDLVIHFGGLYAGGVKGLKSTVHGIREDAKLVIVTVGLADVSDPENTDHIRQSIRKQVPSKRMDHTAVFHLRGGIDYQKLNFKHKTMMTLLYHKVKNLPEDQKTPEMKSMIETFNTTVDFVDYHDLDKILKAIQ